MPSLTALAPRLVRRARADQIATLFTQWPVATGSMVLGASILCTVMWGTVAPQVFAAWMGAIILNQAWRLWLVRRYRAAAPEPACRAQWGRASAVGSLLAGALWGVAGVVLFVPGDPGHQALLVKLAQTGAVILSGDAVHFRENLDSVGVPAFNYDRAQTVASVERIKKIAASLKATLIIQHDARDVDKLPAYPASAK